MVVNNITSAFTHNGVPVANGSLTVYVDRTSTVLVSNLTVNGQPVSNPIRLNSNGGIGAPVETELGRVYCVVKNAKGAVLFGYELISTAAVKALFLPNTTDNPDSIGVTDGASIALVDGASINMSRDSKIEMSGGLLSIGGDGKISVQQASKLLVREGAEIDFGGGVRLQAEGAGAISGLQGAIRNEDTELTSNCRVYEIKEQEFNLKDGNVYDKNSFLVGDLFYFIASKLLEGDAYIRYYNSDGYPTYVNVNQNVSAVLMLVAKVGEGDNIELHFERISDANLKANIKPLFNYTLEKEIGQTFDSFLTDLSPRDVIDGQTLIYDKEGTIGVIIGRTNTQDGPLYKYRVIATSSSQSDLEEVIQALKDADYELERNLKNEINARAEDRESFREQINTEIRDRNASDDALQGRIDSESQARIKADEDLQGQIDGIGEAMQPAGTDRQVILGDGTLTPEPEQGEPVYNAPSSLFALGTHGNAPDYILMEFNNQGGLIEWETFVSLLVNELQNRGVAILPPLAVINSVNLTITAPVNGNPLNAIVLAEDDPANYETGMAAWDPLDEIANGTRAYIAVFTIIPLEGNKFSDALSMLLNGAAPDEAIEQSDRSWRITKRFPATMTANPKPEVTVAMSAGGAKPPTATKLDNGSYASEIEWTGEGSVFNHETSEGTIKLTATNNSRWNTETANVNGTDATGTLSADGTTLTLESAVIWNPNSLAKPTLNIETPAYGATRPTSLSGPNYSVAISWIPTNSENKFLGGVSTGTFTLTAATGYVWASEAVSLNGTTIATAALSADKTTISFSWETPFITTPLAPPAINIATTVGATKPLVLSGSEWVGTIAWTGSSSVFNYETTTATIVLTANIGYKWNSNVVSVNGTNKTGTLTNEDQTLTLSNAITFTPTSLAPSITIAEPAFGNTRPSAAATQDSSNYTTAITWTPSTTDNKFEAGDNKGTFKLTSKAGYVFGSNAAKINAVSVNGTRTSNNQILTAEKIFNIASPNEGTFTDPRDKKTYGWKKMPDGKIWMTENLDYAGPSNNIGVNYNNAANPPFTGAGRLYTWAEVMAGAASSDAVPSGVQGIAPSGWHIPGYQEWANLVKAVDPVGDPTGVGQAGTAGTKLKARNSAAPAGGQWNSNGGGTDDHGFAALPAGYYSNTTNSFNYINERSYWWTTTANGSSAYYRYMDYSAAYVLLSTLDKKVRFSVRCIKN